MAGKLSSATLRLGFSFNMLAVCAGLTLGGCLPSEFAYLASSPEKAEAWLQECEGNTNDFLRKERFCMLAIKSKDVSEADRAFAYATRANIFYYSNRLWEAVDDLTAAISIDPNNALYYENRGKYYEALREDRKAQADFKMADRLTGERRFSD